MTVASTHTHTHKREGKIKFFEKKNKYDQFFIISLAVVRRVDWQLTCFYQLYTHTREFSFGARRMDIVMARFHYSEGAGECRGCRPLRKRPDSLELWNLARVADFEGHAYIINTRAIAILEEGSTTRKKKGGKGSKNKKIKQNDLKIKTVLKNKKNKMLHLQCRREKERGASNNSGNSSKSRYTHRPSPFIHKSRQEFRS